MSSCFFGVSFWTKFARWLLREEKRILKRSPDTTSSLLFVVFVFVFVFVPATAEEVATSINLHARTVTMIFFLLLSFSL